MAKQTSSFELIIIGLGAMGSAALYQAAKAGVSVLGIDRYTPPHEFGSSHAESRITRLAVGEGSAYLPLVARSHEIWRELEAKTGQQLLYQPGGYIIARSNASSTLSSHWDRFVQRTADVAATANIPFEIRTPADVRQHLPNILIQDDDEAGFEPSGGVVLSEAAVKTQLELARKLGATTHFNEPVIDIKFDADVVTVTTEHKRFQAKNVIVSAGAWIGDFFPPAKRNVLRITRQVVYWFEVDDPTQFSTDHFPFFLWLGDTTDDYVGIFPMPPHGVPGLKILTEQFHTATDPTSVSRMVTQTEIEQFYETVVTRKLTGVTSNCIKAAVCLYTNTPDDHFIIDHHPDTEQIILASPCSGHGFKHSAAIGEAMVQLAITGKSEIDLASFALNRFG